MLLRKGADKTIKTSHIELIKKAILLLFDDPELSNREVARRIGVDEKVIRTWKKDPIWEQIRQELLRGRASKMEAIIEKDKEGIYEQELQERQRKLRAYVSGLETIAAHSLTVSSNAYKQASKSDDAIKACTRLTYSGSDRVTRTAVEVVKTIFQAYDQLDQTKVLAEYYQSIREKQDQNIIDI
jgi:hypothetical protein